MGTQSLRFLSPALTLDYGDKLGPMVTAAHAPARIRGPAFARQGDFWHPISSNCTDHPLRDCATRQISPYTVTDQLHTSTLRSGTFEKCFRLLVTTVIP